jgi:phosphomannomutase
VIADDFTFENVRRVAQATADYWNSLVGTNKMAIVGYDNRFLSETYAKLVCEVLAANGIKALYPPLAVPTPAVTFAVRDRKLCGAVMITASHNPPQFNGYKLKAYYAGPGGSRDLRAGGRARGSVTRPHDQFRRRREERHHRNLRSASGARGRR